MIDGFDIQKTNACVVFITTSPPQSPYHHTISSTTPAQRVTFSPPMIYVFINCNFI